MMFTDFNSPAYSEQGHYTDFPEYGKQCGLIEPWRGYRRGATDTERFYRSAKFRHRDRCLSR